MKQNGLEFLKRGLLAASGGPVVLAIVYGILGVTGVIDTLTPGEVCRGILTITALAFIMGGITMVYQMERLPLFSAILIHGAVLYGCYIGVYLLNGWLQSQLVPVLIFTGVFIVGYAVIWLGVYLSIRKKTESLNSQLHRKQVQ